MEARRSLRIVVHTHYAKGSPEDDMDASGMPKKKKKKVVRSLLLAKKDISLTKVVAQ